MTLVIDIMTWAVLVPMLLREASSEEQADFWHSAHHNFESYNVNARRCRSRCA
jgi:hypothetical protein